jgi:hypothetical protein
MRSFLLVSILVTSSVCFVWLEASAAEKLQNPSAGQLVEMALRAEVAGDNSRRKAKLAEAVRADSNYAPARWHLGLVQVEEQWQTTDEVERIAQNDVHLGRYRALRSKHTGTLQGELHLARWCTRIGLGDVARAHWLHVLRADPKHRPALAALGLRRHHGMLLHKEAIEQIDQFVADTKENLRKWQPRIKQWRSAILHGDDKAEEQAQREIAALNDPASIPAVLEVLFKTTSTDEDAQLLQLITLQILGRFDDQRCVVALARLSVDSPFDDVRSLAAKKLKRYPVYSYVPRLLSEMKAPVEVTVDTVAGSRQYTFYQDRPDGTANVTKSDTPYYAEPEPHAVGHITAPRWVEERHIPAQYMPPNDCGFPGAYFPARTIPAHMEEIYYGSLARWTETESQFHARQQRNERRNKAAYEDAKKELENYNALLQRRNARIRDVLKAAMGAELDPSPRKCWEWWKQSNPMHNKPRLLSPGTLVWRDTGATKLVNIQIGDRVLAQDAVTGEVAYKVVLHVLSHAKQLTRRIKFDGDGSVVATAAQPLWATGTGWQVASDASASQLVHGTAGSQRVASVHAGPQIECYNLVVADFHTFLIGDASLLVHDATNVPYGSGALPGLDTTARRK